MNGENRPLRRRSVLKTIGAAGIATTAFSTTAVARPSRGCDHLVNPRSNSPQQYDTIQAAVDAAAPGDTICITPDTYTEGVVIETDDLTLRGSGNPKNVVLDGGTGVREAVFVTDASGVTLDGLTVRNTGGSGSSLESYGIRVVGASDEFTLRNSVIRDISEEARASGLSVDAAPGPIPNSNPTVVPISATTVENCRIQNIYTTNPNPGGDFGSTTKAKGIAHNGDVSGTTITRTTITNIGDTGSGRNSTFGRGVTFTEDDDDIGPSDFEIRLCEFSTMDGNFGNPFDGAALFVGEYPDFGTHVVEDNNVLVAVENFPNGVPPQSTNDVLSAPRNYWGAADGPNVTGGAGGSGSNVTKNVEFTPFRDKPVNNAGSNV